MEMRCAAAASYCPTGPADQLERAGAAGAVTDVLLREVLRLRFAELLMDRVGLMSELRLDVGVEAAA